MAESLTISGKFLGAAKTQTVGQNNRQVRSFWLDLTDQPEYPNTPQFQLRGDRVSLVDGLQKGQLIQIKFNLSGRRFTSQTTGKEGIITNLDVWQINLVQVQSTANRPAPPAATSSSQTATTQPAAAQPAVEQRPSSSPSRTPFPTTGDEDDLPF